jgi:hypothetical protein
MGGTLGKWIPTKDYLNGRYGAIPFIGELVEGVTANG